MRRPCVDGSEKRNWKSSLLDPFETVEARIVSSGKRCDGHPGGRGTADGIWVMETTIPVFG